LEKPYGKNAVIQAIIEAAIPLLADRGINDVSIRDIAKAANVNSGLITRHFGSKEKLIQTINEYLGKDLFQMVQQNEHLGTFDSIWDRVMRENRTKVRAVARIMLEASHMNMEYSNPFAFIDEINSWFRDINKNEDTVSQGETNMMLYMTAALMIGLEIIGDRMQKGLHIDDAEYQELRPRALRIMMKGFGLTPISEHKND